MFKRSIAAALSLLLAAATILAPSSVMAQTPPSMLGLHVSGDKILNGAGTAVQLHGANRSSWEYQCFDPTAPTGVYHDGGADQAEVTAMKAWHINAVRVVLNEDCWLGLHGLPLPTGSAADATNYRNQVIAYVNLLTGNNMAVIVNLHFNGDGVHQALDQEPMADRAHSNDFWTSVATTFGTGNWNNPKSAIIFEPYNEPHDPDVGPPLGWSCWKNGGCTVQGTQPGDGTFVVAGMQEMVNAIRAANAMQIISIAGLDWATDLTQWVANRPLDPIAGTASWHSYNDGLQCQTQSCWDTTLAGVLAAGVPILTTEIGNGNGTTFTCAHDYIDRLMGWLDTHDMQGYLAWVWGPYSCAGDPAILADWNGTPTQTYGQGYHDHLLTRP